ncbi:hypothetical protein ACFL2Q_06615, partial [Thermodesulfobacteriota bacterium]
FSSYGSDAYWQRSKLTLRPVIRVNKAIRVHGVYTIGGYRHKFNQTTAGVGIPPFERYYMSQVSMNAYDTAAIGSWEQFRATIQLPFGIWSIGVKDFPLGTGATLGYNTRAESFLTVVPMGPFRLLGAVWIARSRERNVPAQSESWDTGPEGEDKPEAFVGFIATYRQCNTELGAGIIYRTIHLSPGSTREPDVLQAGTANVTFGEDEHTLIYPFYIKYNNGHFFLNAEYAGINVDRYYLPNNATRSADDILAWGTTGARSQLYINGWHFFAEAGSYFGPTKLSLMYAVASGRDYANQNPTQLGIGWAINYQAMEPYEFLMFNTYGGLNGGFNGLFVGDGHGMMQDGYCFGGRIDYAVASNLNAWLSFIWAHRLERHGTFAGQYNSGGAYVGNDVANWFAANNITYIAGQTSPYVRDGFLGYEWGVGVDWKLLEGLTLKTRYAYWQPGEYVQWAYQRVGYVNGSIRDNAYVEGIDPIHAFQGRLLIEF